MTPAEERQARLAAFERLAWRADVVAAVTLQYDDYNRDYPEVAQEVGISPDELNEVMDWADLSPETEEKLRRWYDARSFRPVSIERVALGALVWRLPSDERDDALHQLHRRAEVLAEQFDLDAPWLGQRAEGEHGRRGPYTLEMYRARVRELMSGQATEDDEC